MARGVNVYRDGKVHVRSEQCENCLLSQARLVDSDHARELVAETRTTEGGAFICHKNQISDDPEAICAAWWALFSDEDWILRLAKTTDNVKYVRGVRPTTKEGTDED